jgi:riboflavin biosynthesis pyrimidine reductase
MNLKCLYNNNKNRITLPVNIRDAYGNLDLPELPKDRLYVSSNFVIGIDGRTSFRELKGRAGGREVSRSEVDRWMMDFIRSFHDAQIVGASTLREESGTDGKGWDYRIKNEELLEFRKRLGLGKQKVLILSGSGNIDLSFNVFNSQAVEPWIVTSGVGLENLKPRMTRRLDIKVLEIGQSAKIEPKALMSTLYMQGVRRLVCEGGPKLYGQFLESRLVDEEWRTISTQVLGKSTDPKAERPTSYGDAVFGPVSAPWFKIVSVHISPPYHLFLRLQYEGPRTFA